MPIYQMDLNNYNCKEARRESLGFQEWNEDEDPIYDLEKTKVFSNPA